MRSSPPRSSAPRRRRRASRRLIFPARLARALALKCDLRRNLAEAYAAGNRRKLKKILEGDLVALRKAVDELWKCHRDTWLATYKPFGLEVIEKRYGGLRARLESLSDRLYAYLSGKVLEIPELEVRLEKIGPEDARRPADRRLRARLDAELHQVSRWQCVCQGKRNSTLRRHYKRSLRAATNQGDPGGVAGCGAAGRFSRNCCTVLPSRLRESSAGCAGVGEADDSERVAGLRQLRREERREVEPHRALRVADAAGEWAAVEAQRHVAAGDRRAPLAGHRDDLLQEDPLLVQFGLPAPPIGTAEQRLNHAPTSWK